MIRVIASAPAREAVHASLTAEGFERTYDPPLTGSTRITEWTRGESSIAFRTNIDSGLSTFILLGPEEASLVALAERHGPTRPARDVAREIARATSPAARAVGALVLRGLGRDLRFDAELGREDIVAPLVAMLRGAHPVVQTAAVDAALDLVWPELDDAVLEVAQTREDLAWVAATWRAARDRNDRDAEKRDREARGRALLDDLPGLIDERRWDEALSASRALFEERKQNLPVVAWRGRALALVGLGRAWEGAIFAAGWLAAGGGADAVTALADAARAAPDDEADLVPTIDEVVAAVGDPRKASDGFEALAQRGPARAAELAFVVAALRTGFLASLADVRAALSAAERAAAAFPHHAASAALLATSRAAVGDRAGALAELARAVALVRSGSPETERLAALSRFERRCARKEGTISASDVSLALARMFGSADDFDAVAKVVELMKAEPSVDAVAHAEALGVQARVATRAKRHDDAIASYRAAIAAEGRAEAAPSGLLRFNLACELAHQGHAAASIDALREAIRLDETYAADARADAYFESVWHTGDFLKAVAVWSEPLTPEAVERTMSRAQGLSYRGDGDEALDAAHRAASGAEQLGDPALTARALARLGSTLMLHATPTRSVPVLERAVALADQALASDVAQRSAIRHAFAAALHAADRLDEAEVHYRAALAERASGLGEDHEAVGYSHGDLARLLEARGQHDEADAATARAIAILERVVGRTVGDDRWDALVNLAVIEGNRVAKAADRGRDADVVLDLAESAANRLDAIVEAGARIPAGTIDHIARALARGLPPSPSGAVARRLARIEARLEELDEADPTTREERAYWAGLRRGVVDLRRAGMTDRDIALAFGRGVRGEDPGEPMASHPAFRDLAIELSNRLPVESALVTVAMVLDLAATGDMPIEKAFEDLERIARVGDADDVDEAEDEDADDEEEEDDEA